MSSPQPECGSGTVWRLRLAERLTSDEDTEDGLNLSAEAGEECTVPGDQDLPSWLSNRSSQSSLFALTVTQTAYQATFALTVTQTAYQATFALTVTQTAYQATFALTVTQTVYQATFALTVTQTAYQATFALTFKQYDKLYLP